MQQFSSPFLPGALGCTLPGAGSNRTQHCSLAAAQHNNHVVQLLSRGEECRRVDDARTSLPNKRQQ